MPQGQANTTAAKLTASAAQTRALLKKGHDDPAFRDKLLSSPDATLQAQGISDPALAIFLKKLEAKDFEDGMKHRAGSLDAEAEAEA